MNNILRLSILSFIIPYIVVPIFVLIMSKPRLFFHVFWNNRIYTFPIISLVILIIYATSFPFNTTKRIHQYYVTEDKTYSFLNHDRELQVVDRMELKNKLTNTDYKKLYHAYSTNTQNGNIEFYNKVFDANHQMPIKQKKFNLRVDKHNILYDRYYINYIKWRIHQLKHKLSNTYKNLWDFTVFFVFLIVLIFLSFILEYEQRHNIVNDSYDIKRTVNTFCIKEILDKYVFYIIPLSIAVLTSVFKQSLSTLTYILIEWSVPLLSFIQFCRINYDYATYSYNKYKHK